MNWLDQFRRQTGGPRHWPQRPPIPTADYLVIGAILLVLGWFAVIYAGMAMWVELVVALLSAANLFLLAWPQPRSLARRLLGFPLFWVGLGMFGILCIQSWNVEWQQVESGGRSMMRYRQAIAWLPKGVIPSLDQDAGPFRAMLNLATPWLNACVVWAGLRSRRGARLLLNALAAFAAAYAAAALYQHFHDIRLIWGRWPTHWMKVNEPIPFWGSFINQNHAGYFLLIGLGLCLGLLLSGMSQAHRRLRSSGPHLLHLGTSLLISVSIAQTEGRGPIVAMVVLWLWFLLVCSVFFVRHYRLRGAFFPIAVTLLFTTFVWVYFSNPQNWENLKVEYERTIQLRDNPELEGRYFANQLAWDLIGERPWLGYGAGSFRYIHLPRLDHYPGMVVYSGKYVDDPHTGRRRWEQQRSWWQRVHNDFFEWIIEYGLVGCALPLLGGIWFCVHWLRCRRALDSGMLVLTGALALVWLAALWDFHFRIPLVATFWMLTLSGMLRLLDLQRLARAHATGHD
jgi:hypothetical protein